MYKKFLYPLILLVVGLFLASCAPSAATSGPELHQATVNDMAVTYHIVDRLPASLNAEGAWSSFEAGAEMCNVYVTHTYLAETPEPAFGILGALANCYGQSQLGFPTDNLDNDYNFINSWIRLYIDRCDRRLGPLGFPAQDGQCDVPGFEEVL